MDCLGVVFVGLVTAIAGGTLRDLSLSRKVFWLQNKMHLRIAGLIGALTFFGWPYLVRRGFKDAHLAFLWSDAIGMASSAVIGAHIGLESTGACLPSRDWSS